MEDPQDQGQRRLTPTEKITQYAQMLSAQQHTLRERLYAPDAEKDLRTFSGPEAASWIGIPESTLRQMDLDGETPFVQRQANGRRAFSLENINAIRHILAEKRPREALKFMPRRQPGEKAKILAVSNFKGGSAKTTTSIHLAHFLALKGLRVLAVDLDPQASLSALFNCQPEFDVGQNETLWAAIRYDDERVPLKQVIRKTYFDGLDLIPANLELQEFEHSTPTAIVSGQARGENIFYKRIANVLTEVEDNYDVIIFDTPPQLGYLTLAALFAASGLFITVNSAMIDIASMNQFLLMLSDIKGVIEDSGGEMNLDYLRFIITRYRDTDAPQQLCSSFLRNLFGEDVLTNAAIETTAIQNAGLQKKSIYEVRAGDIGRDTLKRALESINGVNEEIYDLVKQSWGRAT
ncbi:MAG: plasmid partitioning protein RepA [Cohaesibacteraceae bacterium]|nr:plasmid partitioning protein RepA [Cohaesibacteraceae bacterium]